MQTSQHINFCTLVYNNCKTQNSHNKNINQKFPTFKASGLVLGKFLPPHKGHQYLVDFAQENVDKLYIVVDNISNDVIPVKQRMKWMKSMFPKAEVLTLRKELPQHPEEAPTDFWQRWEAGLKEILPEKIDKVFASEDYGEKLASMLGAKFNIVDKDRANVPICATKIREMPIKFWDYIVDVAKPYFCKRVCIFGPESTGKSTLTEKLAEFFKTTYVPEYAKSVIERCKGDIKYENMEEIIIGHHQEIEDKVQIANKVLFVDTDAITSKIWSNELFGKYPKIADEIIPKDKFDTYLLLNVDVPWVNDIHRYRPDNRQDFFNVCKKELEHYKRTFEIISGDWDKRFQTAKSSVNKLFEKGLQN